MKGYVIAVCISAAVLVALVIVSLVIAVQFV